MPYSDPDRQREYMRKWMAERRVTWISKNGPCVDCGRWEQLEVDHKDAETKVTHRVWSWSRVRREAELVKCVVRCQPCHASKTTQAGEHARGERSGAAKLTEHKVREIRASNLPYRQLARIYKVDEKNIRKIKLRMIWQHVN